MLKSSNLVLGGWKSGVTQRTYKSYFLSAQTHPRSEKHFSGNTLCLTIWPQKRTFWASLTSANLTKPEKKIYPENQRWMVFSLWFQTLQTCHPCFGPDKFKVYNRRMIQNMSSLFGTFCKIWFFQQRNHSGQLCFAKFWAATGWSKKTVNRNVFVTGVKFTKNGKTQHFWKWYIGRFWYFDVSTVSGEKSLAFQGFAKMVVWLQIDSIIHWEKNLLLSVSDGAYCRPFGEWGVQPDREP